jgi:hypothetical protein
MATATRQTRKPARVTSGTCSIKATGNRTLEQALESGDALLTLHTHTCTNYTVQRLSDPDGDTVGYRLMKLTDYIVDQQCYDLEVTGYGLVCDCPDATFQQRECKHARALRAALVKNGITISAPQRQNPAPTPIELEDL